MKVREELGLGHSGTSFFQFEHCWSYVAQVPRASQDEDDSDPDYTPSSSKRLSAGGSVGRKKLGGVSGKRIKVEAENELDHLLQDVDGDNSVVTTFKNRSMVWQVFVKESDGEYVRCTICDIRLKLLSGSTTTMLNHYISKHTEHYQEALANRVQAVRIR